MEVGLCVEKARPVSGGVQTFQQPCQIVGSVWSLLQLLTSPIVGRKK